MTLGKSLVFANLVFGLVMLAWATSLYTSRVDWSSRNGEVAKRDERHKKMMEALPAAQKRLQIATAQLFGTESPRGPALQWYNARLGEAEHGDKGPIPVPVTKDGFTVPDQKAPYLPAVMAGTDRRNRPLAGMAYYTRELAAAHKAAADAQNRIKAAVDEDARLTEELIGEKGLRQRTFDEQVKRAAVEAEIKEIQPREVNSVEIAEQLHRRREQLEGRVEELKKAAAVTPR